MRLDFKSYNKENMKISIIGAGVIGLTCAYYLQKEGHEVTIFDQGDGLNNCSFGNAGYISPSHFIPLASPGIVAQGLKWMLDSKSPFYIKPRMNYSLMKWGLKFYKNANESTVEKNAPHLSNILQLSRQLTIDLNENLQNGFQLETKGCLMLYQKKETERHETTLALEAKKFGIEAPVLSKNEVQAMEPHLRINVLGGVYFPIDCHLHPGKMMTTLKNHLFSSGVKTMLNHKVKNFEISNNRLTKLITDQGDYATDHLVIAAGSWLEILTHKLGIDVLLQPGKGYSTTYQNITNNLIHPSILVDDRVALTPLGNELRIGGTMELGGINHTINMKRVYPMIAAANQYYPSLNLASPSINHVWSGLRPCSPDGLPYIGKSPHHTNVTIAGGHAMLGISLAAATGSLVKQMIHQEKTSIPIESFRINR
jgi:D-amino-acid dehydrogenase